MLGLPEILGSLDKSGKRLLAKPSSDSAGASGDMFHLGDDCVRSGHSIYCKGHKPKST